MPRAIPRTGRSGTGRRQRRRDAVEIGAALLDEPGALAAQRLEVAVARVVELVAGLLEARLQTHVAALGQELAELEVDRLRDAVEDDVDDRARPFELPPAADVLERERARLRPGAERDDEVDLVVAARRRERGVRRHRRVQREDAAVDERVAAAAGDVADADRLEVRGRRGGRAGDVDEREVVGRVLARPRRAEEERLAALDLVGGDEDVGQRLREPRDAERAAQRRSEAAVVVALVDEAVDRRDAPEQRAVEDLRPLALVQADQVGGGVRRRAVVAGPRQPAREDAARRGPRDEVEQVGGPPAGAALDLGEHDGGDEPADAAAVDREDPHCAATLPLLACRAGASYDQRPIVGATCGLRLSLPRSGERVNPLGAASPPPPAAPRRGAVLFGGGATPPSHASLPARGQTLPRPCQGWPPRW